MNKETILQNILESFCDGGGFKEQDFIQAIVDFIPGESIEQRKAIDKLKDAIGYLNDDEKE